VHQALPLLGVVLNVLSPGLTLHRDQYSMSRIVQVSENNWTEVAFLIKIGIEVSRDPIGRIVSHLSDVLTIGGIFSIALDPDSVILLRF